MNVAELYGLIGADYEEARSRLPGDALVARFVVKFLDDSSCADTVSAWRAGDEQAAFEAAHKAKGVCANLALTPLAELSSQICEALRPGNDEQRAAADVDTLVNRLESAHRDALDAIAAFAEGAE